MADGRKRFSIGLKMYLFVTITVFCATISAALVSYVVNVNQIDTYFKNLAFNSAENFSAFVDAEYLAQLRKFAESDEFQAVRKRAEKEKNGSLIVDCLKENGMWEDYEENRNKLLTYVNHMKDLKYLYIIVWGDKNALYDMYLINDDDNILYSVGYNEEREKELLGMDASKVMEPAISHGDWGWLCSAYAPVYDKNGSLICHIGCDVAMNDIMQERRQNFSYVILGAILVTLIVLAAAVVLVNRTVVNPLNAITNGIKKFRPDKDLNYEEAGVIDLNIKSRDEIEDIYREIRTMQISIIDHLHDLTAIRKDKEKVEGDMRKKEQELGEMSKEAYVDPLTSVGSKAAYARKLEELKEKLTDPGYRFAFVMVDINRLKAVNDNYGHTMGDTYIKGCCRVICDTFKHSPVYRIGGDEFIAILEDADYADRAGKLEELNAAYEKSFNDSEAEPWFRYSASAGMAEYSAEDDTIELVFKRADENMYAAKILFKLKYGKTKR